MEVIHILIIIFVFINVVINIFWDGIIAFNQFDWIDKLCKNWDQIKKHFVINQCERWISSINFCVMTIAGIILIIGICCLSNNFLQQSGGNKNWIFVFSACYVIARLLLVSAILLTTNLNDKWLSVLPSATLQIFILGLISFTFVAPLFENNGNKIVVISFIVLLLLIPPPPFIILRIKPISEKQTDINFKFDFSQS